MTTTSTQVDAAYKSILLSDAPGGANGAYAISVAAQINDGLLTMGNFESSLIGLDQTMYTTLPALVTVDAFYGATPSLSTLTTAATSTSGSYDSALQLHNLGYSDANVWTIMGADWGADPNSQFYQLYSGMATGNSADYQTFLNAVYKRVFGTLPTQANLQNLLNDIPGVQQLLNGGGHTATAIQVMGGLFGYLLYAGQSNSVGNYATPAVNLLTTAATDEVNTPGSSASLFATTDFTTNPNLNPQGTTATQAYLTTAADNVTANNIYGSLTPYNVNGVGPTLQATDVINGDPGSTNNTLTISDDYNGGVNDAIPLGTTINNVQNVVLNTQGNAGGNALFDTTPYASVNSVTVNSSGAGTDNVRVSGTTQLAVTHSNVNPFGGVQTYGGSGVTVTNNGAKGSFTTVGSTSVANANPTGNVTVNAVASTTTVLGGANVTVNQTGIGGSVTVGTNGYSVSPAEPTGTVTVNAPATSTTQSGTPITVFGGTDTNLTSGGGVVTVGSQVGQTVFAPTGNDTITDNAAVASAYNYVTQATTGINIGQAVSVLGGKNVTVTTNAGGVMVGQTAQFAFNGSNLIPGLLPTGNVNITDTADLQGAGTPVFVDGGANVSVTDSGSAVTIGSVFGSNVVAPSGTVTVNDTAQVAHDGLVNPDDHVVTVLGGTAVNVASNAGDINIGTGTTSTDPTGNVTVTQQATDSVSVMGGANVTVSGVGGSPIAGGEITIGGGTSASNPTGNVTVTQSGVLTGENGIVVDSAVNIGGGVNVSVTETGGNVTAGSYATPITGTVSIADTQSGPNTDAFNVVGGTTVQINTTATSGAITVGSNNASLNSSGTALQTPTAYATGNVTIVNETVPGSNGAGSTAVYGTGADNVYTNGATSVSVTGGITANITDMQTTLATGGANAGKAIGTSTLATVSLDGVSGAANITSGALANLTVADSSKGAPTAVTVNETAAHSLALTLNNDATGTSLADATLTALAIADAGTASNTIALNTPKATSLTLNNADSLTISQGGSNLSGLKTITGTGAGAVVLPDLTGAGSLTMVDFSAAKGAVTVTNLNPTNTSFKGGTGSDTIGISNQTFGNNSIVAGTASNNTLIGNFAGNDTALGANSHVRGFTTFQVGAGQSGTYDAAGFGALVVGTTNGGVVFDQAAAGTTLSVQATDFNPIQYNLLDNQGGNDSLTVTVGVDNGGSLPATTGIAVGDIALAQAGGNTGLIASLTINSVGKTTGAVNTVTVNDTIPKAGGGNGVQAITVTGDSSLTLNYVPGSGVSNVSSVNASGATGTSINVSGVQGSVGGVTFTGGVGMLTAGTWGVTATSGTDSFTSGSGGGNFTLGLGGSWNPALNKGLGSYDVGSEQVNLSASTAVSDTLNIRANVTSTNNVPGGGVTGFQSVVGPAADTLNFVSATNTGFQVFNVGGKNVTKSQSVTAFANTDATVTGDLGVLDPSGALANLTFTSSNGVISFGAAGNHTLSEFTQSQLITAAEAIVTAEAATTNVEQVAAFSTGGNTFVVTSDQFGNDPFKGHVWGASVVELDGVTGIASFGNTGAATSVDSNAVLVNAGNAGVNTGSKTYTDTGFSEDNLTNGTQTTTNTYSGLGAAAILIVGGGDQGNAVVTQTGPSGSNSLTVNMAGSTLESLTVNGDGTVLLTGSGTVKSLVDATNTMTTLSVTGAGAIAINSIADTALTTIDASKSTGSLTATASQSGLTVLGALGGDTITANGAGDTIKVGSTKTQMTGNAAITANASGDTIALTNEAGGGTNTIGAASSGDTITVDSGTNVIGGTIKNGVANFALGANDTVNLLSSSGLGAGFVNDTVWVGDNSTVNLGTSTTAFGAGFDTATINVTGDLAQAGSAGSYHETTINGASSLGPNAQITLDMLNLANNGNLLTQGWAGNTAANAEVNVATASSLGQALDTAASQALTIDALVNGNAHTGIANGALQLNAGMGLADWFQWGGNTYIVESINPTGSAASHAGLAATDSVVKLAGLVNLGTSNQVHAFF